MNILIPDSWLREYLTTNATPQDIQRCLSLCGPSVERLLPYNLHPRLGGRKKEGGIDKKGSKDYVYDIEITTNRVDCMSVIGIAREASATLPRFGFKAKFNSPTIKSLTKDQIPNLRLNNDPKLCHRLLALPIYHVQVKNSPDWVIHKLESVGQRGLNNLVDITNYVMWETGHPVHVFDLDRITTGRMNIRQANKGEKITTLDGKNYSLQGGEVIIDDGTGKIIDLPSIIGTANSVVNSNTHTALFFIDDIVASKVRFASMSHNIRTQAAALMEKGVDPRSGDLAIGQIVKLITKLLPDAKIGPLLDIYPNPKKPKPISFSLSQISNHIGVEFTPKQIVEFLSSLQFEIEIKKSTFIATPPSWRIADVTIWQDLAEEIARIYGYHNISSNLMSGPLPDPVFNTPFAGEQRIKTALKYLGFTEVYTYSLVPNDTGLKLKNPLTREWKYLRTSLFPSHAEVIAQNLGRVENLDLFEIAHVYLPRKNDLPQEQMRLIISTTNTDYYQLKGKIETLITDLGITGLPINIISKNGILYWEEALDLILEKATQTKSYTPISKFAPIYEDINVFHNRPYAQIITQIYKISPLIKKIDLVDKYEDKLTLRITFHSDDHQLSSEEIAPIRIKIQNIE